MLAQGACGVPNKCRVSTDSAAVMASPWDSLAYPFLGDRLQAGKLSSSPLAANRSREAIWWHQWHGVQM